MKTNCRKKSLTFGEFIAAAHDVWGGRRAGGFEWLAVNAHWVQFRGQQRFVFSKRISITSRFERTIGLKIQPGQGIPRFQRTRIPCGFVAVSSPFAACGRSTIGITQPAGSGHRCPPKSVPDPIEPFNRVMWGFNVWL